MHYSLLRRQPIPTSRALLPTTATAARRGLGCRAGSMVAVHYYLPPARQARDVHPPLLSRRAGPAARGGGAHGVNVNMRGATLGRRDAPGRAIGRVACVGRIERVETRPEYRGGRVDMTTLALSTDCAKTRLIAPIFCGAIRKYTPCPTFPYLAPPPEV